MLSALVDGYNPPMTETTPDRHSDNTEPERDNPGSGNAMTAPSAEGDTAPTEQSGEGGSPATGEVTDDLLPEDLRPTDDNPLAKPPGEDEEGSGMQVGSQEPPPGV